MKEHEKMDDVFRRLRSHSMTPSEGVWEGIMAGKQSRKRGLFWWLMTPVLLLGAGLTGYMLYSSDEISLKKAENTPSLSVNSANKNAPNPSEIQSETPIISFSMNEKNSQHNYLSNQTSSVTETYKLLIKKRSPNKKSEIVSDHKEQKNAQSVETIKSATSDELLVSAENTITDSVAESENWSLEVPQPNVLPEKVQPIKNKKPTTKPKATLLMGIDACGLYAYRSISTDRSDLENFIQLRNQSEVSLAVAGTNLKLGVALKNGFFLWSGIGYQPLGLSSSYSIDQTKWVHEKDTIMTRLFSDPNTGQTLSVQDTVAIYKVVHQNLMKNGNQIFHFVRIPLQVEKDWKLGKNLALYGQIGVSLSILAAASGSIADVDQQKAGMLMGINQTPLRRMGADFHSSAGLVVPVDQISSLRIGASAIWSPLSIFNDSYALRQKLYGIGVEVGYRRKIN